MNDFQFVTAKRTNGFMFLERKFTFGQRIRKRFVSTIIVVVFIFLPLATLLTFYHLPPVASYVVVLIPFVLMVFWPVKKYPLTLDLQQRYVYKGKITTSDPSKGIPITNSSVVRITREFRREVVRHRRSSTTYYYAEWKVFLDDHELIAFETSAKGTEERELYNQPWIDEISEVIAETFNIPLVDETGMEQVVRKAGETDTSLRDLLKADETLEHGVPIGTTKYFQVTQSFNQYMISSLKRDYAIIPLLGFFVTIFVLYFLGKEVFTELLFLTKYLAFWGITIAVLGIIFVFLVNGVARSHVIVITPSEVQLVTRGILWSLYKEKISLREIEKLVKYQTISGKYALEFITDRGRFSLTGSLDLDAIEELEMIIRRVLVSL